MREDRVRENRVKISNKLLSSVMGCECEFIEIRYNFIVMTIDGKVNSNTYKHVTYKYGKYKINLDTFVRIAEESFISDFLLSPVLDGVVIFALPEGDSLKSFGAQSERRLCPIENKMEAIEYLATKV